MGGEGSCWFYVGYVVWMMVTGRGVVIGLILTAAQSEWTFAVLVRSHQTLTMSNIL